MRHLVLPKHRAHGESITKDFLVMECVGCTIWTVILLLSYIRRGDGEGRGGGGRGEVTHSTGFPL